MKHRLQTLLKHKLQWLVLLTVLLGVSQGAWGTDLYVRGGIVDNWGTSPKNKMTENPSGTFTWVKEVNGTYSFKIANSGDWDNNNTYGNNGNNNPFFGTPYTTAKPGSNISMTFSSGTYIFKLNTADNGTLTVLNCNTSLSENVVSVLEGTKICFYAGIDYGWENKNVCLNDGTNNLITNASNVGNKSVSCVNDKTFNLAPIYLASGKYNISNSDIGNWEGVLMPENAEKGTIYVLYKNNGENTVTACASNMSISTFKFDGSSGGTSKTVSTNETFTLYTESGANKDPYGTSLEVQYYAKSAGGCYTLLGSGDVGDENKNTKSGISVSGLSAGEYTLYALLTDKTKHRAYIKAGSTLSLTVTSCTPPESSYFSVTNNMFTYDGESHEAEVDYSGDPAAYTPSPVTATYGSDKASSVSAAGEYDIYVSASGVSSYCDVTDLKLTGEGQKLIICAPPIPGFSASAGSKTLYFSNGDNVSTTLSTAANSNWEYEWFCTQSPTYSGTTYSPSFSSYTSNSTTVTFPIEGVYKFKVKARCTCDHEDDDAWVESTEVTVTVHLKLHLKGPITCSACAFTGDCETYTAICDLTNTNTVTYNFIGYYKNNADYKGEFCINASNSAGDGNHIHTSDTYTYNNLNLTAGITYNTSHNYNLMSDGLTIAETGTPLSLTITHTGGKNYTLSLALLNCPDISIKTQPSSTSQILCKDGSPTNLTVEGQGGTTPYTYQWYQNSESATSGATMVSGATSATLTPATSVNGTLYYYCVVTSAGLCSDKKATSNVSGGVTVATPKLTASATSVTNFTPVTITSDVVLNGTKFTIVDVQSTDSYLYENTTESVIFKGDVGDSSSKTFRISGTAKDVSCTGTVDITVSKDANSCD